MERYPVTDPYFWALISMFGLVASNAIQGSAVLGKSTLFGLTVVITVTLGRIVLVLPICVQPRFDLGAIQWPLGGILIIAAGVFIWPGFKIKPLTKANKLEPLKTTGVYGVVRNPTSLGNILWSLGWSIGFGSIIGVALTPLWWLGFLFHTLIEEEDLRRTYGNEFEIYKAQVPGRIIPGLPI